VSRAGGSAQLGDVLERQDAQDRARALRLLLRHGLLTPAGPDPAGFVLARKHAGWLRDWLENQTGWSLQVATGLARLRKVPASLKDGTRPAVADRTRTPFTRRRYVLLCLALAALERTDAQVTLGRLAERILQLATDPELQATGLEFTLDTREERSDLATVARFLLGLHVLVRVAGDEQAYVTASGDALYDVDRQVLAGLMVAKRGPSMVEASRLDERMAAITEELTSDTDEGRNRALRHKLARRLLDDPVVYYDQLAEAERAYLTSQRPFLLRRLTEATGLVAEVRAEGIALVDPTGEATDLVMPEEGTDGHATLLLAKYLAGRAHERPGMPVNVEKLTEEMARLAAIHRADWRRTATEPGAQAGLCRMALDRLEALGLIRRVPGGVLARPALARFQYAEPTVTGRART
jgi:uncharacterized protein (TIGR02678 family)